MIAYGKLRWNDVKYSKGAFSLLIETFKYLVSGTSRFLKIITFYIP